MRRWAAIALLLLSACAGPADAPEQQIARLVENGEAAAEARSVDRLKELMAPDYADESGRHRRDVLRLAQVYFLGHRSIHLLTRVQDIQIQGPDTATAIVLAGMTGTPVDDMDALLNQRADLVRFDLRLARDGDDWQVIGATWRRAVVEDFLD